MATVVQAEIGPRVALRLRVIGDAPLLLFRPDGWSALDDLATGRCAFPAAGFRASAIEAVRYVDGLREGGVRRAMDVPGEFVPVVGAPAMWVGEVRVGGRTFRRLHCELRDWSAVVDVRYDDGALTREQIEELFRVASVTVGVGCWRPRFGAFHVAAEAR